MKTNLSIGIPTYNQGQFLQETIDSILNQTILPDEIVISNNHSTDILTNQILDKYKENKLFKIVVPDDHIKMCSNWNFTAKNCSSKFFTLISSDDIFEKNFVEEFLSNHNPSCLFYRLNFNIIDEKGSIIGQQTLRSVPKIQSFPNNLLNQFYGPKGGFPAFIVSKKLFEDVGNYDEKFNYYADWHLLLKIAEKTKFYHINTITSNYRVSYREGLNYSRLKSGGLDDIIFILDYLLDKIETLGLKRYKYFLKNSICIHMSSYLKSLKAIDKKEIDKINIFIMKSNVKIENNNLKIQFRRLVMRIFEFTLRFIKIS